MGRKERRTEAAEIYDLIGQTKITINKRNLKMSISEHEIEKLSSCRMELVCCA